MPRVSAMNDAHTQHERAGDQSLSGLERSVLRVGCLPHVPAQRLLAFLGALGLRDPRLETHVLHDRQAEQLRRLDGGELDVAMLHDAGPRVDVEIEPVFPGERLAAFLPLGHPLTAKEVLRPRDLLDLDLVIFPQAEDPALHDHVLSEIDRGSYRFRGVVESPGAHVRDVLLEVARGRGIAIGAWSLAELSDARWIVARRALDPGLSMPETVLAWRASRTRQLQHALAIVRAAARDLRGAT
jgi:DNA-binding transcriptional LysR family regulator